MPIDPITALSAGASVLGGIFGAGAARRRARAARRARNALSKKLAHLEANRQDIIDPYAGVTNLSALAQDLSSQMSNPYMNLGVATKAAEMKIEEADISLANTLDTLRSTGAAAGGATALAQAALKAKKEVASDIESQEAENERLRAQGEQQLQEAQIAEKQRVQGIQLDEGARVQEARARGAAYAFEAKEQREMQQLDRTASQLAQAEQALSGARASGAAAMTGMLGNLTQLGIAELGKD